MRGNWKHSLINVIPTWKMGKGLFIPLEIMGGLDNVGMAKFFCQFFSPLAKWCSFLGKSDSLLSFRGNVWVFFLSLIWRCCPSAKWCCPSGKSIEFFFSHSNFVLRSRKKTQWTFLQDNIILLQDNIIILRSWKKNSNISSSGQKRVWLSFETTSFCRRRKRLTKKSCIPRFPNPPMISWGIKSPFTIFRVGITFLRECSFIFPARTPSKLHCGNYFKSWRILWLMSPKNPTNFSHCLAHSVQW